MPREAEASLPHECRGRTTNSYCVWGSIHQKKRKGGFFMVSNCVFGSVSRSGSLFVCGCSSLLGSGVSRVSVAGARAIDAKSSRWLEGMMAQLGPSVVVVSGLALGADTVAFKSALKNGNKCIAVLPSGFDNITPRSNLRLAREIVEAGGLLVSEYAPHKRATRATYVARNRIIARLGKGLIVPQFEAKSGTRHTVDFAQQLGRWIAVQNADYSGNRFIINNNKYITIAK